MLRPYLHYCTPILRAFCLKRPGKRKTMAQLTGVRTSNPVQNGGLSSLELSWSTSTAVMSLTPILRVIRIFCQNIRAAIKNIMSALPIFQKGEKRFNAHKNHKKFYNRFYRGKLKTYQFFQNISWCSDNFRTPCIITILSEARVPIRNTKLNNNYLFAMFCQ